MPEAVLGDLHIRYREAGQGFPVLLLHGSFCTGASFAPLARMLSARFRVLVPDLPGHGASRPAPPSWTTPDLARHMLAFLDALGIGQVHAAGHSMGGDVAMSLGVLAPKRCRTLVSIGSAGAATSLRGPSSPSWIRTGEASRAIRASLPGCRRSIRPQAAGRPSSARPETTALPDPASATPTSGGLPCPSCCWRAPATASCCRTRSRGSGPCARASNSGPSRAQAMPRISRRPFLAKRDRLCWTSLAAPKGPWPARQVSAFSAAPASDRSRSSRRLRSGAFWRRRLRGRRRPACG
ncbi:MAG: alpha/beta fold hydrolase [Desulfovibrio sp.]|nr:alpha/beta fold hydrolase [Desulfovibrio sp.]